MKNELPLIEIKSICGNVLYSGKLALRDSIAEAVEKKVDLSYSDLSYSDLRYSDLRGSDLRGSDLRGSDLSYSDLRGSNLRGSDLSYSDLRGSTGISEYLSTPLLMLLDQPGLIRAYKLTNEKGCGPYYGGITYEMGKEYFSDDPNIDPLQHCGAGINVATLDWCMREWKEGYHIFIVEFTAVDIAVIPTATDGKFRLLRCKMVGEKNLIELGLIKSNETT